RPRQERRGGARRAGAARRARCASRWAAASRPCPAGRVRWSKATGPARRNRSRRARREWRRRGRREPKRAGSGAWAGQQLREGFVLIGGDEIDTGVAGGAPSRPRGVERAEIVAAGPAAILGLGVTAARVGADAPPQRS